MSFTVGYTTTPTAGAGNNYTAGYAFANGPYTMPQSGVIQSCSIWFATGPTGTVQIGIYSAISSSQPGTLLAKTAQFTPVAGWNTVVTTTNPTVTSGTQIFMGAVDTVSDQTLADANAGFTLYDSGNGFSTLPATFKNPANGPDATSFQLGAYATFNPTASTAALSATARMRVALSARTSGIVPVNARASLRASARATTAPVVMPITGSNLTGGFLGSAASSYTTASISPAANALVIVAVSDFNGAMTVPTVTGAGGTWVLIGSYNDGTARTVSLFRDLSATPGSGALTISFATNPTGCEWSVDQFVNVDTSGTHGSGAIVQTNGATQSGTFTGFSVQLTNPLSNPNNAGYGLIRNGSLNTISAGAGFTELDQVSDVTKGNTIEVEYGVGQRTPSWTWTNTSLACVAGVVEIKAASSNNALLTGFSALSITARATNPVAFIAPAVTRRLTRDGFQLFYAPTISLSARATLSSALAAPPCQLIGSTATLTTGDTASNLGWFLGTPISLPAAGKIQNISVQVYDHQSGNIWLALYSSTSSTPGAGQPNTLIAQTLPTAAVKEWQTFPTTSNPLVLPGQYWLCIITDNNIIQFSLLPTGTVWAFSGGYNYTTPPNPVPINVTQVPHSTYAIYANFTLTNSLVLAATAIVNTLKALALPKGKAAAAASARLMLRGVAVQGAGLGVQALLARSTVAVKAVALPRGKVAISGAISKMLRLPGIYGLAAGTLQMVGRAITSMRSSASVIGSVPLSGSTRASSHGSLTLMGNVIAMTSRAASALFGRFFPFTSAGGANELLLQSGSPLLTQAGLPIYLQTVFFAPLTAAAAIINWANASNPNQKAAVSGARATLNLQSVSNVGGNTKLAAVSRFATRAKAGASILLRAILATAFRARAASTTVLPLSVFGRLTLRNVAGVAFNAHLSTKALLALRATASSAGIVGLAGFARATLRSTSSIFAVFFNFISGRASLATATRSPLIGATPLAGRSSWLTRTIAGANFPLRLIARTSTNIAASITGIFSVGDLIVEATPQSGISGFLGASPQFTLNGSATALSTSLYLSAAAGNVEMALYDSTGAGGAPGNLIAFTASVPAIVGWNTISLTSNPIVPAGSYWVVWQVDSNTSEVRNVVGGPNYYVANAYGPFPSVFPSPSSANTHNSAYATFKGPILAPSATLTMAASAAMRVAARPLIGFIGQTALYATAAFKAVAQFGPPIGTLTIGGATTSTAVRARSAVSGIVSVTGRSIVTLRTAVSSQFKLSIAAILRAAQAASGAALPILPISGRAVLAARARIASAGSVGLSGAYRLFIAARSAPLGRAAISASITTAGRALRAGVTLGILVLIGGRLVFASAIRIPLQAAAAVKGRMAALSSAQAGIVGTAAMVGRIARNKASLAGGTFGVTLFAAISKMRIASSSGIGGAISILGRASTSIVAAAKSRGATAISGSIIVLGKVSLGLFASALALSAKTATTIAAGALSAGRLTILAGASIFTTLANARMGIAFPAFFGHTFLGLRGRATGLTSLHGGRIVRVDGEVIQVVGLKGRLP
jgi:hypothetical protein